MYSFKQNSFNLYERVWPYFVSRLTFYGFQKTKTSIIYEAIYQIHWHEMLQTELYTHIQWALSFVCLNSQILHHYKHVY